MARARIIVFDLFETLLHDVKFDFASGLSYLYQDILSTNTDKKEFLDYAASYWKELYHKRSEDNSEVAFKDELLDFKNKYGFKVNYPIEDILFNCALEMNATELFDDTISTLEKLKRLGIPMYLLSNSIFNRNVMNKFINRYNLKKYFINTYFSADYKIRKPHRKIFEVVLDDIKKMNSNIELEQVYFIGDNYEADVMGAYSFGFTPVYINRKNGADINCNHFIEIKSLNGLFDVIR